MLFVSAALTVVLARAVLLGRVRHHAITLMLRLGLVLLMLGSVLLVVRCPRVLFLVCAVGGVVSICTVSLIVALPVAPVEVHVVVQIQILRLGGRSLGAVLLRVVARIVVLSLPVIAVRVVVVVDVWRLVAVLVIFFLIAILHVVRRIAIALLLRFRQRVIFGSKIRISRPNAHQISTGAVTSSFNARARPRQHLLRSAVIGSLAFRGFVVFCVRVIANFLIFFRVICLFVPDFSHHLIELILIEIIVAVIAVVVILLLHVVQIALKLVRHLQPIVFLRHVVVLVVLRLLVLCSQNLFLIVDLVADVLLPRAFGHPCAL
eukprot:m.1553151 g.1553151  ORF g.1553151 m.1553151 type:complete len:319 (+) comp25268_c1_seq5:5195-6151(+)